MKAARKLLLGITSAALFTAVLVNVAVRLHERRLRCAASGGPFTLAFPSEQTHLVATADGATLHVGRTVVMTLDGTAVPTRRVGRRRGWCGAGRCCTS